MRSYISSLLFLFVGLNSLHFYNAEKSHASVVQPSVALATTAADVVLSTTISAVTPARDLKGSQVVIKGEQPSLSVSTLLKKDSTAATLDSAANTQWKLTVVTCTDAEQAAIASKDYTATQTASPFVFTLDALTTSQIYLFCITLKYTDSANAAQSVGPTPITIEVRDSGYAAPAKTASSQFSFTVNSDYTAASAKQLAYLTYFKSKLSYAYPAVIFDSFSMKSGSVIISATAFADTAATVKSALTTLQSDLTAGKISFSFGGTAIAPVANSFVVSSALQLEPTMFMFVSLACLMTMNYIF